MILVTRASVVNVRLYQLKTKAGQSYFIDFVALELTEERKKNSHLFSHRT